jgi:hypothetical protein
VGDAGCNRGKGIHVSETQMLIHCLECNQVWDIDHDPDGCTCDSDADWNLVVVNDDD